MAQVQEQDPKITSEEAGKPRPEQMSYENAPPPPPPEDSRRKSKIRFIVLAVLVVAAIASIPVYSYYAARESTDDAQVDGHLVPISPRVSAAPCSKCSSETTSR